MDCSETFPGFGSFQEEAENVNPGSTHMTLCTSNTQLEQERFEKAN